MSTFTIDAENNITAGHHTRDLHFVSPMSASDAAGRMSSMRRHCCPLIR
jgi:hypothetical protein